MIAKFAVQVEHFTGAIAYFVGPSVDQSYNKNPFTAVLEDAKMYDSMGHAVATGNKLHSRYQNVIASVKVIEVEILARPTGGIVVEKSKGVKTGDQSRFWVMKPALPPIDTSTGS